MYDTNDIYAINKVFVENVQKQRVPTPQDNYNRVDDLNEATVIGECYKANPEGTPFKFLLRRVAWSGDEIETCSICGMTVYDPDWDKFHKMNEEMND